MPHVLEEPVRYRTPYQDVTVDGEVEAKLADDVHVRATVSGIERNEAIRITSDD